MGMIEYNNILKVFNKYNFGVHFLTIYMTLLNGDSLQDCVYLRLILFTDNAVSASFEEIILKSSCNINCDKYCSLSPLAMLIYFFEPVTHKSICFDPLANSFESVLKVPNCLIE
jgi:hypothetical protein